MSRHARFRTGDQALVRAINLALIMRRLFEHRSLSRATLADVTGLNKSTVSSLVQELHDMGFVREAGLSSGGVGRPSVMLELDPQAGLIVSAELGVDSLAVKCANFAADVLHQQTIAIDPSTGPNNIINHLITLLRETLAHCRRMCAACDRLLGIAIGVPGLVEQTSGTLLFAPNLHWENVPLLDRLRAAFAETPIFVDNEANLAALGEYFFGAAQGYEDVLFISAGNGLGGAIIRSGQIAAGRDGFAGEFGHMTMDPDGIRCNCGNTGCWETQVNQGALFRTIRQALAAGATSTLNDVTADDLDALTVAHVLDAAETGDTVARDALEMLGRHLGIGIASLINALNPDLVLLGGTLSHTAPVVIPVIEAEITRRALRWHAQTARVMQAQHGADACTIGGIARVCQQVLRDPAGFRFPTG